MAAAKDAAAIEKQKKIEAAMAAWGAAPEPVPKVSTAAKKEFRRSTSARNPSAGSVSKPAGKDAFSISGPTGPMKRVLHVDTDYNWEGKDPAQLFTFGKKLGEGAYGSVFAAVQVDTGFEMAIKTVKMANDAQRKEVMGEIEILKKLSHPNIVKYYGCCVKDEFLWIMMENCHLGSLKDLIKKKKLKMTEAQISSIVSSTLKGLTLLHAGGIIHRDLKCANILLTSKAEAKLADFGVSFQAPPAGSGEGDGDGKTSQMIGTALFCAPEVLSSEPYDASADIWSLGITAIEMAEGDPPHLQKNEMAAMFAIISDAPPSLKEKEKWSTDFVKLLDRCLQKDPTQRPSSRQLMTYPFILNLMSDHQRIITDMLAPFCEGGDGAAPRPAAAAAAPIVKKEKKKPTSKDMGPLPNANQLKTLSKDQAAALEEEKRRRALQAKEEKRKLAAEKVVVKGDADVVNFLQQLQKEVAQLRQTNDARVAALEQQLNDLTNSVFEWKQRAEVLQARLDEATKKNAAADAAS